eukprot:5301448-Prymnesium_polylepis.1
MRRSSVSRLNTSRVDVRVSTGCADLGKRSELSLTASSTSRRAAIAVANCAAVPSECRRPVRSPWPSSSTASAIHCTASSTGSATSDLPAPLALALTRSATGPNPAARSPFASGSSSTRPARSSVATRLVSADVSSGSIDVAAKCRPCAFIHFASSSSRTGSRAACRMCGTIAAGSAVRAGPRRRGWVVSGIASYSINRRHTSSSDIWSICSHHVGGGGGGDGDA